MTRIPSLRCGFALAALLCLAGSAIGANLLTNPSFEDLTANGVPNTSALTDGAWMHLPTMPLDPVQNAGGSGMATPVVVTDWDQVGTKVNGAGAYNPPAPNDAADGQHVLFTNAAHADFDYVHQVLTDTLLLDKSYTLSFLAGNTSAKHVQLYAGATLLGEITGAHAKDTTPSVSINADAFPGAIGSPLEVRIPAVAAQAWYENMSLEMGVGPIVRTVDAGTADWTPSGVWGGESGPDMFNGDELYQASAANGATGAWAFSDLPAGNYMVYASWRPGPNRTTVATYALSDGYGMINSSLDQSSWDSHDIWRETAGATPDNSDGEGYARLSNTAFAVTDGTLEVIVSDDDAGAGAGRFLMADAARIERVRDDVQKIYVIDNSTNLLHNNGTVVLDGPWGGWPGDVGDHFLDENFGTGAAATATYTFTGIDDGLYRVSANWTGGGNRPLAAVYTIPGVGNVTVNQQIASAGDTFEEVVWQDLFTDVVVAGNTLSITLSNGGGGGGTALIADAMRLELIPEPSSLFLLLCAAATLSFVRRRK